MSNRIRYIALNCISTKAQLNINPKNCTARSAGGTVFGSGFLIVLWYLAIVSYSNFRSNEPQEIFEIVASQHFQKFLVVWVLAQSAVIVKLARRP